MKIAIDKITSLIKKPLEQILGLLIANYSYEPLNRGYSSYGNIAKGFQGKSISFNPDRMIFSSFQNEGLDIRPDDNEKGGIIVFPTDVNADMVDDRKIIISLKQKFDAIKNRMNSTNKVDKLASKNNLAGWTVGYYLNGKFTTKDGKQYDENSISIEIIGVESTTLREFAEALCESFSQESVLLKDLNTGEIFFMKAM